MLRTLWVDIARAIGYLVNIAVGVGAAALAYWILCLAGPVLFPEQSVRLLNPVWHVEPRESAMIIDGVTLKNDSEFDLKDLVIGCEARGESGTIIETMRATVYRLLKGSEEIQVLALPLAGRYPGQAASTACRVIGASHSWNERSFGFLRHEP